MDNEKLRNCAVFTLYADEFPRGSYRERKKKKSCPIERFHSCSHSGLLLILFSGFHFILRLPPTKNSLFLLRNFPGKSRVASRPDWVPSPPFLFALSVQIPPSKRWKPPIYAHFCLRPFVLPIHLSIFFFAKMEKEPLCNQMLAFFSFFYRLQIAKERISFSSSISFFPFPPLKPPNLFLAWAFSAGPFFSTAFHPSLIFHLFGRGCAFKTRGRPGRPGQSGQSGPE